MTNLLYIQENPNAGITTLALSRAGRCSHGRSGIVDVDSRQAKNNQGGACLPPCINANPTAATAKGTFA